MFLLKVVLSEIVEIFLILKNLVQSINKSSMFFNINMNKITNLINIIFNNIYLGLIPLPRSAAGLEPRTSVYEGLQRENQRVQASSRSVPAFSRKLNHSLLNIT